MSKIRIATMPPIEENQADGDVATIFDDIERTKDIDFVPAPVYNRDQRHTA